MFDYRVDSYYGGDMTKGYLFFIIPSCSIGWSKSHITFSFE